MSEFSIVFLKRNLNAQRSELLLDLNDPKVPFQPML